MLVPALPAVLIGQEGYVLAPTGGAFNAVWPVPHYNVFAAVLGFVEKLDYFLKAGGFVGAFQTSTVPDSARLAE
jgi:hypothetical protein